jgi:hypothetical protein
MKALLLSDEIITSVIKTGEAALLLWLGSYLIARAIQKHKARLDLQVALTTRRAAKIEEVSTLLFQAESAIQRMARTMKRYEADRPMGEDYDFFAWSKKFRELAVPVEEVKEKALDAVTHSYYLLGPSLSKDFLSYYQKLNEYASLLETKKHFEAQKALDEITANKPSVLDILKQPDI